MKDALAIAAQVVDIQNDARHKGFIKITVHVPEEGGDLVSQAFGIPSYTRPVPVALARLDLESVQQPKPKQKTSLAVTAGMLCKQKEFQKYILRFGYEASEEHAADYVRLTCGVDSRSEIEFGTRAAEYFDELQQDFLKWLTRQEGNES